MADDLAVGSAIGLALIAGFKQGVAAFQLGAIEHGINLT